MTVKAYFFSPIALFIQKGEDRQAKQKVVPGPVDETTGEAKYVNYVIQLPERSLPEFLRWVNRFMNQAMILSPASLAEQHRQVAIELVKRYSE